MELQNLIRLLENVNNFNFFTDLLKNKISGSVLLTLPENKIKTDLQDIIQQRLTFDCDNCGRPIHTSNLDEYYECECGREIYLEDFDVEIFYILNNDIYTSLQTYFEEEFSFYDLTIKIIFGESIKLEIKHDRNIYLHITPFNLWTEEFLILEEKYADHFAIGWNYFLSLLKPREREGIFQKIFDLLKNSRRVNLYKADLYLGENTINILHLSDFHLKSGSIDNKKSFIVKNLIDDLKNELLNDNKIDLVLITGDLTDSGKIEQFKKAEEIVINMMENPIDGLGVNRNEIYIVPGNHDIDREFFYEELFNELTKKYDDDKLINIWYRKDDSFDYNRLFSKFKAFKSFQEETLNQSSIEKDKLYIVREFEKLYYKIGILGLNTVWSGGTDAEKGKLLMSQFQVIDAFAKDYHIENYDLNIAFFHHPIESLNEDEREIIESLLYSKFDLVFNGHKHDTRYKKVSDYNKVSHLTRAGPIYGSDENIYGSYNLIQLDVNNNCARIIFRKPVKLNPYVFFFDIEISPNKEDLEKFGVLDITLPKLK